MKQKTNYAKKPSKRRINPDGLLSFHRIGNGYFLMFDKDLGPFIINKDGTDINIYDYRSRKFRYRGPYEQLWNESKTGKIILAPITDKSLLAHLTNIMSLSLFT